jgi:hypothetical protein
METFFQQKTLKADAKRVFVLLSGLDGTRTRDLLRDRQAF